MIEKYEGVLYRKEGNRLARIRKRIEVREVKSEGKQTKLNNFTNLKEENLNYRVYNILNYEKVFPIGEGEVEDSDVSVQNGKTFDSKKEAISFLNNQKEFIEFCKENRVADGRRYLWRFEIEDGKAHLISKNTAFEGELIELGK